MSRAGARTLSDLDAPAVWIACELCGRLGRYNVARLIETYGDETLPALLDSLARCPKQRAANVYDRCRAHYLASP